VSLACTACQYVSPTSCDGCCPRCRSRSLYCTTCGSVQPQGSVDCAACRSRDVTVLPPGGRLAASPALAVPRVSEVYAAGRYGVTATVMMPAGDVEILNELATLAELLSAMATKAGSGLRGYTEHTRKMVRDMRILAADIQEEIEQRRGPL